jgi:tRNA (guanine-N7-)-methyltransferase
MQDETPAPRRAIRSFVRRNGRITHSQQRALDELWSRFGIDFAPGPVLPAAWFGREAPCTLEIGFGNGEHLLARAITEPTRDFIGIEVHRSGVGHLLNGAAQAGLANLRVICHDAVEVLRTQFAPGCVDELQLLFPDPWPKARHHKRRIVQAAFVELVARVLRPGGELHMATDWAPYAEHMREVLATSACFAPCSAPSESTQLREPTRFERRGLRLGHAICDLRYRRAG